VNGKPMPARSTLAQKRSGCRAIRHDALQKGLPARGKSGGPSRRLGFLGYSWHALRCTRPTCL